MRRIVLKGLFNGRNGGMNMYKEYMLKCECWNPLEGTWESSELFFDTEKD